jgi:hypothetical protein
MKLWHDIVVELTKGKLTIDTPLLLPIAMCAVGSVFYGLELNVRKFRL